MVVDIDGGCFVAFGQLCNGTFHGSENEQGGNGHHHREEYRRPLHEEVQRRIDKTELMNFLKISSGEYLMASTSSPMRYVFLHYKITMLE